MTFYHILKTGQINRAFDGYPVKQNDKVVSVYDADTQRVFPIGEMSDIGKEEVYILKDEYDNYNAKIVYKEILPTKEVKDKIKNLFHLGPLHLPANYTGIDVAKKIFTSATQVAVFDTAFHQTMPPKAYRYAIPKELYTTHNIRAYGFHGTSHKYVSEKAIEYLNNPKAKIITIHLGNGSSMAAVDNGKCVDTTMGLGPLSGLIMGTRSGDIDATVIFHLVNQLGYDISQVDNLLNKKSGLLGLAGSSDMRDVKTEITKGNSDAILAYEMYAYRIKKYIGAYAAAMGGLNAVVFTGGIGENDNTLRELILKDFEFLNMHIDINLNNQTSKEIRAISTTDSIVKALVIPTNEELEIALQCYKLLNV